MNIDRYIKAANDWLARNRPAAKPITLADVEKRLKRADLLSVESDAKTVKSTELATLTGILYLAPHNICGFNVCAFAVTCIKDCLMHAGRGRFGDVTRARIIKTLAYFLDPETFKANIEKDIISLKKAAAKRGLRPSVRLNGTSDLPVHRIYGEIMGRHPDVQFYDYTKVPITASRMSIPNYHTTFSYDGQNLDRAMAALSVGVNVAVVFYKELPLMWNGYPVIDGDKSDARFADQSPCIVGLLAKGSAKDDPFSSEFVVTDHLSLETAV